MTDFIMWIIICGLIGASLIGTFGFTMQVITIGIVVLGVLSLGG